jgi:hypothetical protein
MDPGRSRQEKAHDYSVSPEAIEPEPTTCDVLHWIEGVVHMATTGAMERHGQRNPASLSGTGERTEDGVQYNATGKPREIWPWERAIMRPGRGRV